MSVDIGSATKSGRGRSNADNNIVLSQQLANVLNAKVIDFEQLSIKSGQFIFVALLDVHCLNDSGALFDAALLASVQALENACIPTVYITEDGLSCHRFENDEAEEMETNALSAQEHGDKKTKNTKEVIHVNQKLDLSRTPLSLTIGVFCDTFIADPTADEEGQLDSMIKVVVDDSGDLVAIFNHGGTYTFNERILQMFIQAATTRHGELLGLLKRSDDNNNI